ncbi:hypothetical protein CCR97_09500 [Rhodoplanes elegans]|uniref:HTH gntR-type domain-containing protein n=1 Tax=Rhodoplanes elegans TaxID=29408 RepID=A0A327KT87_9BRAD|nr:GntR family transcriptional regulator [Rhodoplanes elegans]MBK5958441.1 hypothetical protein [Rhodoplanes elegans]RAI41154.1 hypothetical protein CH338_04010 [Rhodoplanes elegans]
MRASRQSGRPAGAGLPVPEDAPGPPDASGPPEPRSVADAVYAILRQRLMAGHFVPGAQLKEEHIAADLAVSRTPVRAALKRLTLDGMVVAAANRGVFVAEWTEQDIIEVFELRLLLEARATGLASQRATVEQIARLEALNDRLAAAIASTGKGRIADIQRTNSEFHHAVVIAAGSPRLRTILDNLLDLPVIIGSFYFYTDVELLRSLQHHRDIATAIAQRNRDYAEAAMRLHLQATYGLFMQRRQTRRA